MRDKGLRYDEISILTEDMAGQGSVLRRVCRQMGVPLFADEKRAVGHSPAIRTAAALLRFAAGSRYASDMTACLKPGLLTVPAAEDDADLEIFENYCRQYHIRGDSFFKPLRYGVKTYGEEGMAKLEAIRSQLADLLSNDQIKPMGRTVVYGDEITTEWTGTGFEANLVVEEACDLTVGYDTSYNQYYSITVDGVKTRLYAPKGVGTFSVPVTAGERNVRVVVETQNAFTIDSYSNLTTISFIGTLGARPADKDLFIEFVGDSYTCGDGSMGTYVPGQNWSFPADDASTEGFAYKAAQLLDADYSLVARGGIGLFGESAEAQQETDSKLTMAQVYDYDGAHRDYLKVQDGQTVTPHDFSARTPDVIVVELGANDGISHMDLWLERATDFINQLRDRNGPDPVIVWFTLRPQFYQAVDNLFRTTFSSDPNLRVFRYTATAGTGSAAKNTQYSGHPSAEDHTFTAQATAAFLEREALPAR